MQWEILYRLKEQNIQLCVCIYAYIQTWKAMLPSGPTASVHQGHQQVQAFTSHVKSLNIFSKDSYTVPLDI